MLYNAPQAIRFPSRMCASWTFGCCRRNTSSASRRSAFRDTISASPSTSVRMLSVPSGSSATSPRTARGRAPSGHPRAPPFLRQGACHQRDRAQHLDHLLLRRACRQQASATSSTCCTPRVSQHRWEDALPRPWVLTREKEPKQTDAFPFCLKQESWILLASCQPAVVKSRGTSSIALQRNRSDTGQQVAGLRRRLRRTDPQSCEHLVGG